MFHQFDAHPPPLWIDLLKYITPTTLIGIVPKDNSVMQKSTGLGEDLRLPCVKILLLGESEGKGKLLLIPAQLERLYSRESNRLRSCTPDLWRRGKHFSLLNWLPVKATEPSLPCYLTGWIHVFPQGNLCKIKCNTLNQNLLISLSTQLHIMLPVHPDFLD